jgi:hypothetical protein
VRDWLVVIPDFDVSDGDDWAFWVDGVEFCEDVEVCDEESEEVAEPDGGVFELLWFCAAGGGLIFESLDDWANAPVPSNSPTAVVINKRCFIFHSPLSLFQKAKTNALKNGPFLAASIRGKHSTFA